MIPVNKPFMPPRHEYEEMLEGLWERAWLTNNGELVQRLERRLKNYLDVSNLWFVSNGTVALQIAIKALGLTGEVITTPFSYVATTSSLVWEGCTPVFADIDPETLNIDPARIEEAITPRTSGILATHVYGNPCDIEAIRTIADRHDLKVIYDAAHCFGTTYKGKSVFAYGDVSATSFHATKLFHTGEGGAVFSPHPEVHERMRYMRNFGHDGPYQYDGVGINGKNSELHAAMGLVNLRYVDEILGKREADYRTYQNALRGRQRSMFQRIVDPAGYNYAYAPILLAGAEQRAQLEEQFEQEGIGTRRYFHPALNTLSYTGDFSLPVTASVSERVLCLPLYYALEGRKTDRIAEILKTMQAPARRSLVS